jgi:host factor-I protein
MVVSTAGWFRSHGEQDSTGGSLPVTRSFTVELNDGKGDRHMDSKPAQNIQDTFLNTVRKDKTPITIYLVSGVKLTGKIRSFDKYSVLLENNSQEQLIFKHAISTVVSTRSVLHGEHRPPHAAQAGPVAVGPGQPTQEASGS